MSSPHVVAVPRVVLARRRRVLLAAVVAAAGSALLAPSSALADRTWDRGAGTNFWTDAANWNPDGLPTSADVAILTDTGAGTVDLNASSQPASGSLVGLTFNNATTGYTVQNGGTLFTNAITNSSGAAVTNTISARVFTNSITVNSGTLVLANSTNTINGPVSVAAGAKLDVMAPSSSSLGAISLNGGTLTVRGGVTNTPDALSAKLYANQTGLGVNSDNLPVLNNTPTTTVDFKRALDIQQQNNAGGDNGDTVFTRLFNSGNNTGSPGTNPFTFAATGYFKAPADGDYTFKLTYNDDQASVWLDSARDGFGTLAQDALINQTACCNSGTTKTVTLTANTLYPIAFVLQDTGGDSALGVQITGPAGTPYATTQFVNPADAAQAGIFSYDTFTAANLNGSAITVTAAGSVADVQSSAGTLGNISFNDGTSLTVQGLSGAAVTVGSLSGAGTATLTTSVTTAAGPLSGFTTFTKAGAARLTLGTDAPGFGGAIVVTAGTLRAEAVNALGNTTGFTTVQSGGQLSIGADNIAEPLHLAGTGPGNTGAVENGGADRTYSGPIVLDADAFLVASSNTINWTGGVTNGGFQARFGGAGTTNVNTVGISGTGGLRKTETGTLNVNAISTYSGTTQVDGGTLSIAAALTGTPTVNVTAGIANLNTGGSLPAVANINVTGGTFNANAGIPAVAAVSVTSGTYNANHAQALGATNNATGTGVLRVIATGVAAAGPVNVTGGGELQFDAANTSLTTPSSNVSVNGGTVHAKSGVADLSTQNIVITPLAFTSGLRETALTGDFNEAAFTPAATVVSGPAKGNVYEPNEVNPNFPAHTTYAYTGKIYVPDNDGGDPTTGAVAFAENFDDSVLVKIDGVQRLRNTTWNDASGTGGLVLSVGYHDFEARFGQGTGGAGANDNDGWVHAPGGQIAPAFGIDLDGSNGFDTAAANPVQANYVIPDDATVGPFAGNSLFALQTADGGTVQIDRGAQLRARTITGATTTTLGGRLTLAAGPALPASPLQSDTAALAVAADGVADIGANHTFTAQTISLPAGGAFTKTGSGTLVVPGTADVVLNRTSLIADNGLTDLSTHKLNVLPVVTVPGLQGRLFVDLQLDPRSNAANVSTVLAATPNSINQLTSATGPNGGLDFRSDADVGTFFNNTLVSTNGNHNYTVAFTGTFTAAVAGQYSFGFAQRDDNATVFLDSNQDGVFQDSEKIVDGSCCGAVANFDSGQTPSLTAGQTYAIAIVGEETGGGSSLGVKFQDPAGGPISAPVIIAPGAAGQTTQFNYVSGGGTVQVNAGATLKIAGITGAVPNVLISSGSTGVGNATLQLTAAASPTTSTVSIIAVDSGTTGVLDVGANHTLAATGVSTADSTVLIKTGDGRLIINTAAGAAPQSGELRVNQGVLGGTGGVNSSVTVNAPNTSAPGVLSPGNSIGTFTVGNLLTLNDEGVLAVELDPASAGQKQDQVVAQGVQINGADLVLTLLSAPTALGQTFLIVDNQGAGSTAGTFDQGSTVQGTFAGTPYGFTVNYAAGSGANDIVLTNTGPVPEPGSLAVLGLAGLAGLNRRRRRRQA